MYEVGGFIVNFFDRAKVGRVSQGYEILSVDEFEEGGMPRKLFRVTQRKPLPTQARQHPGASPAPVSA
jgi:hypothetical protein